MLTVRRMVPKALVPGSSRAVSTTVLIYRAGNAEPSFAAAICADRAGTAAAATAAGEALARRVGQGG